jgi:hypothetical protein
LSLSDAFADKAGDAVGGFLRMALQHR